MANHPHAIIISGEPPFYIPRLCIADTEQTQYIPLNEIVYLKGDGKSTTLYLIDPATKKPAGEIYSGYNLGYFDPLLEYRFAKVNQSYSVRLQYVCTITKEHSVKICIEKHPVLLLSDNFRKEFYYKMEKSA